MKKVNNWTQIILNSLIAITIALLAGCGGGGSSDGSAPVFETGPSGVIVDPYITDAVLVEEATSGAILQESNRSDARGRFVFKKAVQEGSIIRTKVGYQGIHNGEPFRGTLKTLVNGKKSFVLSPITTLMANGASGAEIITLLEQAGLSGLSEIDLLQDPMAGIPELDFVIDEDLTLLRAAMSINAMFDLHNNYDMGINEISSSNVRFEDLVNVVKETINAAAFDQMVIENASLLDSLGHAITRDYAVAASVKVTDSVVEHVQNDPSLDPLSEAYALMVYAPDLAQQYLVKDNRGDVAIEQAIATGQLPDIQSDDIIVISDTGEIINDTPGSIEFAVAAYQVGEEDGQVQLTFNRFGGSDGVVSVDWRTSQSSAAYDVDYAGVSGAQVTFADGETIKQIVVEIIDDTLVEGDESFNVLVFNPTGGALIGSIATAQVTIVDNDVAEPTPDPTPEPTPEPVPPPVIDPNAPVKAFVGAEGFGTDTPAGRGGQIIKVTNLNDSGAGSLRAAITASGPRIVVFEVGGSIELNSKLYLDNPFITIAGQTAPFPGIQLKNAGIYVRTHDVLIQHLRIRPGDADPGIGLLSERHALAVQANAYNVVIDHNTLQWATDENAAIWSNTTPVSNVTFSNNLIAECLVGGSYGMAIGTNVRQADFIDNISIHNNLFAHHTERQPKIASNVRAVVANNLAYNGEWGFTVVGSAYGPSKASFHANHFISGTANASSPAIAVSADGVGSQVYLDSGLFQNMVTGVRALSVFKDYAGGSQVTVPPVSDSGITFSPVADVRNNVLNQAGAWPAFRDQAEDYVVTDVSAEIGYLKDRLSDTIGWPSVYNASTYRSLAPYLPVDPNGDDDGNGYTNIEEVLYQMALEVEGR